MPPLRPERAFAGDWCQDLDLDRIIRPHGSLPRIGNTIPTSAKLATSEQVNVRCPFLFSSMQGCSYDRRHCQLYQSLGNPVLPEAADSFFWPSCHDALVFVSRVKTGEKFAWVGTTNNLHTTCRQDCVFTVTNAAFNHGPRQMSFRHLRRCLYTACAGSARVSAQVAVGCFGFPPFLTCPLSSCGVDLPVLYQTHLHSYHSDFFPLPLLKENIRLYNALRLPWDFSSMWPVLSVLPSSRRSEHCVFSHTIAHL